MLSLSPLKRRTLRALELSSCRPYRSQVSKFCGSVLAEFLFRSIHVFQEFYAMSLLLDIHERL